MSEEDYGVANSHGILTRIIIVMISTILIIGVVIPFIGGLGSETVSNASPSDVRMVYIESAEMGSDTYYVNITMDGESLVISGDYNLTSTDISDQIIVLSDKTCIYLDNGTMYYNDGTTISENTDLTVSYMNGKLMGIEVDWVYYPTDNGEYSSFTSLDYVLSEDKVGYDPKSGEIVENWKIMKIDGNGVVMNVHTKDSA